MAEGFEITVTRSAGTDGAVVVFIDGDYDAIGGLRVLVNDFEVTASVPWEASPEGEEREAPALRLNFLPGQIAYPTD